MKAVVIIVLTLISCNAYSTPFDTTKSDSSISTKDTENHLEGKPLLENKNKSTLEVEPNKNSSVRFSISFGYNWFNATPTAYKSLIVRSEDSLINISGDPIRSVGIVSAVLSFKDVIIGSYFGVFKNLNLHINIPLTDISFSQEKLVGLFNKEIAIGFGVSSSFKYLESLSLGFLINLIPYDEPDEYYIKTMKFTEKKALSKVELSEIPTKKKIYYPMGLYLIYSF